MRTIKIKKILRDEKINIAAMTRGFSGIGEIPHQIFLCKKKKLQDEAFILHPKKAYPKYLQSAVGKKYAKTISKTKYEASYIALIDSIYSFTVSQSIFNELFQQNHFCLWHPSEPIRYFNQHERGYIPFFRVFRLSESIQKDLILASPGIKGRHVISALEDEIEVTVSGPVVSDAEFNRCKNEILGTIEKFSGDACIETDNTQMVRSLYGHDLLAEIKAFEKDHKDIPETQKETLIQSRIGQGKFRSELVEHWGGCAVTGCNAIELLKASHIKPWCVCNNTERLDKFNGLLLSPNLDAAFDSGLISFLDDCRIIISDKLTKNSSRQLGIHSGLRISKLFKEHRPYLAYHRKNVFNGMQAQPVVSPFFHEKDIYQIFQNWRETVGPQKGWGLAWLLAYEFCNRYYTSHGIVPHVIEHDGLGYYGIQLDHIPCNINSPPPETIGRFTMAGDVENWIRGGPGDHGLELTKRIEAGEPVASLLSDALRHMDISSSPPRPHSLCGHKQLGKQYELVFSIATILALRNDGVIRIWNNDYHTREIAKEKDPNFNSRNHTGYFLFQYKDKKVIVSGDGRFVESSGNSEQLWGRYMKGASPSILACEIERELGIAQNV